MRRIILILTGAAAAFLLLAFLLIAPSMNSKALASNDLAVTPTMTPTATPSPVFSATMAVTPSQSWVDIGDTLVVTVSVSVSQGCQYPIYELALQQVSGDGGEFAYVSPPTHTVGPPVTNPFVYTLTAVNTGTVSFNGQAYGERYCGDYWNWTYVNGVSAIIYIGMEPYLVYLPMIGGE
ncbi:MAG: hypothetical protein IAE79_04145 [Anaerolinea sp.]|nr:hypothetical protein [Anaerolinea sp.]